MNSLETEDTAQEDRNEEQIHHLSEKKSLPITLQQVSFAYTSDGAQLFPE